MIELLFLQIKVFILIMAILNVIKNILSISRILIVKEGKITFGKYGLFLLGLSIAYISTALIVGL